MRSALSADGPSVVSVECAADEIPPFAPFLGKAIPNSQGVNHHVISKKKPSITKESASDVVARA
jgi:acetolactate synthase-1/2/3 large subunit